MTTNKTTRFDAFMDDMRVRFIARYEASETLKAEFLCGEDYFAFCKNTPAGRKLVRGWREYHTDAENMAAFAAAEAAGRVRIL